MPTTTADMPASESRSTRPSDGSLLAPPIASRRRRLPLSRTAPLDSPVQAEAKLVAERLDSGLILRGLKGNGADKAWHRLGPDLAS